MDMKYELQERLSDLIKMYGHEYAIKFVDLEKDDSQINIEFCSSKDDYKTCKLMTIQIY